MSNTGLEPVPPPPPRTDRRFDFRILYTAALIAVLCGMFWVGSRYPSLQGKASADPNEALSTPLGFERHWPEPPRDQVLRHIGWTSIEWAITNREGMTFGLLLAAGMLTILPLLRRARGGKLAGAIQGFMVGTPLGVCVNCAAPIAQGMLKGGGRLEIALGALFSSPSFNVVVLGIVLAIFPWYLAALKILAAVIMVLVGVPWLARLAEKPGWTRPVPVAAKLPGVGIFQKLESFLGAPNLLEGEPPPQPKGFLRGLGWVLIHYPRNLWRVTVLALPLMLLAGVAGAVLSEIIPWDLLTRASHVNGFLPFAALLVGATAFGVLLPVPIAFDVIVCSVLLNAGMPIPIVAALLATLGIYSVYAWSLLGTTLSWKLATAAALAVFVVGLGAGAAASVLENWHDIGQARQSAELASLPAPAPQHPALPVGLSAAELKGMVRPQPPPLRKASTPDLQLWYQPFDNPGARSTKFNRIDGATLGFKRLPLPRPYQTMQPGPMHFSSLAAGDVNDDGWPDVAAGSSQGVFLYVNLGGKFAQQRIDFPEMRDWLVCDVALVDLDGDGALDLYFSAWGQGGHILYNRAGEFSGKAHTALPRSGEMCAASTAFADVDGDGLIDLVTGGATFESWFFYPAPAVNRLWRNQGGGRFVSEALPGPEGDTLSLLFTDLDGDGKPDLLVGNDFDEPDRIFMNQGGRLRPVKGKDAPIPYSTMTTMSFDTADIDNDGSAELYVGQIAMGRMGDLPKRLAPPVRSCSVYTEVADLARCDALARFQAAVTRGRDTWDIGLCKELADPVEQRDCAVAAHYWTRILLRLPASGADKAAVLAECEKIPADFTTMHDVCRAMADSPIDGNSSHKVFTEEIPSMGHTNLLFARAGKGFRDVTKEWGVGYGGWTWNAKFADLDNDGWQDLFIAQGTRLRLYNPSNTYYRNKAGKGFEEKTREAGFEDHLPTAASLFIDYDGDGSLDVITYPLQLTPVVWRNDVAKAPAFEVRLEDLRTSNRFAVGARVDVKAADGRRQMREIKASGGNQSHDPLVARFGLGEWGSVASMTVRWPDGEKSEVKGPLEPGRYRLVRAARPQPVAGATKAD
ncbi:MAG TPA: FG-GAP-like repeat-containing protein [Myxococcales bacterium]|nr:FG-GAP-like repeat-containing protein [Myxococcales bacterium]